MSSKNSNEINLSKAERQKNLDVKKVRAEKIIRLHVAGAFAVGFIPIPFSDAPILLANQAMLVDNVLKIYEKNDLKELLNILLGQIGISLVVSQIAIRGVAYLTAQLLKILPFLGKLTGGLINGTVAGAITYSYGAAISSFCYSKCKAAIYSDTDSSLTDEDIRNFTLNFKQAFNQYSTDNAQIMQ